MSVYYREKATWLEESMNSMWNQTEPPAQFVLVCDGPLSEELDAVIRTQQAAHPELTVHRLEKNGGLAQALNAGLPLCRYEYVARMDSDDIALPDRMEKELGAMRERGLDLISGWVGEFTDTPDRILAWRKPPESEEEIRRFYVRRNPFNHPAVTFRRSVVERAGGYEVYPYFEDYQLWIKILSSGGHGGNLAEPVLYMRAGEDMYRRRGGWAYWRYAMKLERYKLRLGLCGPVGYLVHGAIKGAVSLMPASWRQGLYQTFLR
jgi:glycosyltransferase involved in cell wall biosynthesis